jgi:lipopolysaccharide export LptBFGC system permease protein LptF
VCVTVLAVIKAFAVGLPALDRMLALIVLGLASSVSIVVPAAAAFGWVSTSRRWNAEGAMTGLAISGRRAVDELVSVLVVVGCLVGLTTAVGTLWLEPLAKRSASALITGAPGAVLLSPGAVTRVGDADVYSEGADGGWATNVRFSMDGLFGAASRARVVSVEGVPAVELGQGSVWLDNTTPVRIRWKAGRWTIAHKRRTSLAEEDSWSLFRRAENTARLGLNANYERSVWYKRFLHPLSMGWLPMVVFPLHRFRYPMTGLLGISMAYLLAVRLGDGIAMSLGPLVGAMAGPAVLCTIGSLLWLRR